MTRFRTLGSAVDRAEREAPFLRGLLMRHPEIPDQLISEGLPATLSAIARGAHGTDPARELRIQRQRTALAIALADLAGAPLEAITAALTGFADTALENAIHAVIRRRVPGAEPAGLVALALGKQGSGELNYSSDIDPILLFDPGTLPHRSRDDPQEAAVRMARDLVALLSERTAEGHVLRVDLRLRPAAEAAPLAVPIGQAIAHYESSALPWERAAFIRARAAAGDIALGREFLTTIRPFIWRRGLDYGVIGEMRALSRRIRGTGAGSLPPGPGFDLKRGRGGIREIEFFVQIQQLIHGGRDLRLRAPATLDALQALAAAGLLGADEAERLGSAYRLFRTIEHRLQMIDDRQTHRLPADPAALDGVARLADYPDGEALLAALVPALAWVGDRYDALERSLPGPNAPALPDLSAFADPAAAGERLARWRRGEARTTRSQAARDALEAVLPNVIARFAALPQPDIAFDRLDALIGRLPSAVNLFRLLQARPALIDQLAVVLAHAPALAEPLGRDARLLDGLIDRRALAPPPAVPALVGEFARTEAGDDYQALLDHVRVAVGERRFQLGVQIVTGSADPLEAGKGYARVAEAALEVLARATIEQFEGAHGRVPGGELLVMGYGRLGGGILTHASDLDLVYLFTGDFLAESDGPKPLGATQYFNRLAARVSAALSVATPAGPLYPVDTRLRPSGAQGLLAVSLDSFARYQAEDAWTWESMALTRARPVFGSAAARAAVERLVGGTLQRPRDAAVLRADAMAMRAEIARHKPPAGPLDVKLAPGGLVDAEFAVHLLQLSTGCGLDPGMLEAAEALAAQKLLAADFAASTALLTRLLIVLRLVAPDTREPVPATCALMARICGQADWPALTAAVDAARRCIGAEWRRVAGLD
jgi:glutamate-ammonia-ligase adenylyltransferase